MTVHHLRTTCRGCGGETLDRFLELGRMPLANALLDSAAQIPEEKSYPLDVYFCETCGLVQLLDVIDPEALFRDYVYTTGVSETMAAHNLRYAEAVAGKLSLGPEDLVVEVASNDGSLLTCFRDLGVRVLGVEPASNIAAMANAEGIETLAEFFTAEMGALIRESHGPAAAVVANNVFAHVDDPVGFLRGMRDALDDRGLVVIEVPYLRDLVDRLEFDTIYHEHLCYFSISALARIFERADLSLIGVDQVAVHGGSLRLFGAKRELHPDHNDVVKSMMKEEVRRGLTSIDRFERFAEDVEDTRKALLALLEAERRQGNLLAGYGAPAKGNTLLNYCGIGTEFLEFTVDRSPLKVGRLTPGMHIPILSVETLLERMPDRVLILAWNFAEEIVRQQAKYQEAGGGFIVPIPRPEVLQTS